MVYPLIYQEAGSPVPGTVFGPRFKTDNIPNVTILVTLILRSGFILGQDKSLKWKKLDNFR